MESAVATLTSFHLDPAAPAVVPRFAADVPPGLARRFRESYDWFNYGTPAGMLGAGPPYAQFDGAPNWPGGFGRGATGAVQDRQAGRDAPKFWSEIDLRGYRVMSRWLWDTNPFMIGFGARLVDYHVGKGYQWQACLVGQKKQAYATGEASRESPDGRLVTRAQNILDAWRDRSQWPLRSREGFRRLRRDGEVAQRFFAGGAGELPSVRWVNPEQIGSPTGDVNGDGSFGVRTADGDAEHVTEVYVRDHDGDGSAGEWVNADPFDPAARVVFFRTNVDADVKRGLPDSFSVHESLDECKKLVRNMVVVACAQAAIAWLEKFPTATEAQVRAGIPTGAPRLDVPSWGNGTGDTVYSEKVAAGTVLRTEGSREFMPGPSSASVANYVEAEQAALRMVCVRWGLPPYMTAKADDINFASSLTAGSPFAVAVEGGQVEWGAVERATAMKVLDLAAEAGLLTWEERRRLDVEVVPPTVTSPDKAADTQRLVALIDKKLVDPYTAMQELGYDPSHVEANWLAWNRRNAAVPGHPGEGGALLPGEPPPQPPDGDGDGPFGGPSLESVAVEGFTGTIRDKRGAELHYQDGKRVAAAPKAAGGGGGPSPSGGDGGDDGPPKGVAARALDRVKAIGSAALNTRVGKILQAVEHRVAVVAHAVRAIAAEAARNRRPPMDEDGVKRLTRALTIADFAGGSVAGLAVGAVNPLAGKAVSATLPTVSVLYVAYSAGRDPAGTWAAARKVVGDMLSGRQAHESADDPYPLADALADLLGGDDADWREAVFLAALAAGQAPVDAVRTATAAPAPPAELPAATADDFGGGDDPD